MSPILYIEARCDECNDEIASAHERVDIAILRDGSLLCEKCGNQKIDHVLKWFIIPKMPEPERELEEEPTVEERIKEIEDREDIDDKFKELLKKKLLNPDAFKEEISEPDTIDRAREEQLDRKC